MCLSLAGAVVADGCEAGVPIDSAPFTGPGDPVWMKHRTSPRLRSLTPRTPFSLLLASLSTSQAQGISPSSRLSPQTVTLCEQQPVSFAALDTWRCPLLASRPQISLNEPTGEGGGNVAAP